MVEQPIGKLIERLRSICQDEEWIQQVLSVPCAEEAIQLLQQKQVTVGELQKDLIKIRQVRSNSALSDEELTAVMGGNFSGDCAKSYNWFLCDFSFCPNSVTGWAINDYSTKKNFCKLGYWHEDRL